VKKPAEKAGINLQTESPGSQSLHADAAPRVTSQIPQVSFTGEREISTLLSSDLAYVRLETVSYPIWHDVSSTAFVRINFIPYDT
jgi:hypothetical protein